MPFICNDFSFDDSLTAVTSGTTNYDITLSGYTNAGFLLPNGANGYINAMGYGNPVFDWLFIASEIGGNTALPVGDQIWMTTDLNGLHSVRLGGHWSDSNTAGPFHFAANGILSTHNRTMGGRLAYIARKTS
ncbi:hypothetical protein [Candidatus Proelusimicrobium excrementi]|uniref:hypothetical protein n=1 Tax=Candidatus Proelusimicrobium excrementi TaxID=3416222 RepID=UPI003D0A3839